jgi:fructokinase
MILVAGEILFDLFPDSPRLGGAPFNFACHLKMLGHDVRFVSRVGQDEYGERIMGFLGTCGFDTGDIQQDPHHPTGTVNIIFNPDGTHDFHINENVAYDYLEWNQSLKELAGQPRELFYFGSLIRRSRNNDKIVRQILSAKQSSGIRFCDINLRKGCYTQDTLNRCLASTDVLKLNSEELVTVTPQEPAEKDEDSMVRKVMATWGVGQVILTRGADGSTWYGPGESRVSAKTPSLAAVQDTVGAGDAFAAVSAAGMLQGLPVGHILSCASQFASKVCEVSGAIPDDPGLYRHMRRRLTR